MNLVDKMQEIADTLAVYDQKTAIAQKDYEKTKADTDQSHKNTIASIERIRDENMAEARNRKEAWDSKLESAKKYVYQLQQGLEERAYTSAFGQTPSNVADTSLQHSIEKMEQMDKRAASYFQPGDNDQLIQIAGSAIGVLDSFNEHHDSIVQFSQSQYNEEMSYAQRLYASASAQEETSYTTRVNDARSQLEERKNALHNDLVNAFNTTICPQDIRTEYDARLEAVPSPANYVPPKEFPDQICFGYAGYEVTEDMQDTAKKQALTAGCGYMLTKEGKRTYLKFPYGYSFTDPHFSTLFEFDSTTRSIITDHMQSLVLRLMMSTPCNKAWLTLIDPIELGKTFAMFAPWGDAQERVIDTRIWHDEARIEERLQAIIDHTSDVNFRCLQGRFDNIIEYNKSAGKNAEPLRFLVIMDFPRHFTPSALDKLESIVTNGPSTGVFALIAGDVNAMQESLDPAVQRIRKKMNVFPMQRGAFFTSDTVRKRALRFMPMSSVSDDNAIKCVEMIKDALSVIDNEPIKPEDVYDPSMRMMSYDASNGISVPIGVEGANKRVELKLGGVSEGGRAKVYHAMIGGTIGSGKSNVLHAIIHAILLHYDPSEVQLYLVDMKDGVEFKRYAQHMGLRNFRVVAIDAEKEFGLAVLQELTIEQEQRSQRFREAHCERLETYNRKMRDENRIDEIMPRLIVIMDEVQWMFNKADDPITQECAHLMETLILMGGSAYGIQIILATQDWANVEGLKEGVFNNIGVRIALKNTKESAQRILAQDNEVITRLATFAAGQAIFNEYAGHKDYNREYRGVYVEQKEAHEKMEELERLQQQMENGHAGIQRLLSSDIQDHERHELQVFAKDDKLPVSNEMYYRLFIGESLGLVNNFCPVFSPQSGKNLLLVGSDEGTASTLSAFAAMSLLMESIRIEGGKLDRPVITIFDFSTPIQRGLVGHAKPVLKKLVEQVPGAFRVFQSADAIEGLQILENDLATAGDAPQHFVIFFGLNRARRLTDGSTYAQKPRDILARLLHDGPEKGMNFIVWANSPSAFQQFYGDTLGDFELRLAFEKIEDELYPYYVQDKKPEAADERNAISFNLDGDNQMIKLYSRPTDKWIEMYAETIRKHLLC